MPRNRRTITEGISQDRYSLTARVQVGDRRVEQAFPQDTPIKEIQRWREEKRVELQKDQPLVARGTLAADVPAYLERVKKRPASWKSKRSELAAWASVLGHKPRHRIGPADIDQAIALWRDQKVALKTILNRCRTLHHLYVTLANDKKARTPLDNVDVPRPPKRRPVYVEPQTIIRVEKKLRAGDPKMHARFMVLASTGIRPSQLGRLTRANVNLTSRVVLIESAKGGEPIAQVLTGDMLAAWQAFIAADAWGAFDATKFARLVRAAGWPSGVRVYNAKHSVGIALAEAGAENEDIRAWFGHTDAATTRIYTGVPLSRMRRLSEKLEGRFGWEKTLPRSLPRKSGGAGRKVAKSGGKSKARKSA
jgi:site-specific recombinase XerD